MPKNTPLPGCVFSAVSQPQVVLFFTGVVLFSREHLKTWEEQRRGVGGCRQAGITGPTNPLHRNEGGGNRRQRRGGGDLEVEESVDRASDPAGAGRGTAPTCFGHSNRGMLSQRGRKRVTRPLGPSPRSPGPLSLQRMPCRLPAPGILSAQRPSLGCRREPGRPCLALRGSRDPRVSDRATASLSFSAAPTGPTPGSRPLLTSQTQQGVASGLLMPTQCAIFIYFLIKKLL